MYIHQTFEQNVNASELDGQPMLNSYTLYFNNKMYTLWKTVKASGLILMLLSVGENVTTLGIFKSVSLCHGRFCE